ncbi:MAG: DUF2703 domain-containing protein [Burkholderiales bacterium]|nr:DUF2703 domain-containing protein [Burkholderiales bacterium]
MKTLSIVWQRLIDSGGRTCDRCGATHEGLRQAVAKLEQVLQPLGIKPALETREMDADTFKADPSQSNRVWIAGKPIEEWLGARVASSPCCSVCGDSECRTIEMGNAVFEAIPPELILEAALIAASRSIGPGTPDGDCGCKPKCCADRR